MVISRSQQPPKRIDAPAPSCSNPATIIFLHGYGDDADGWTNIAQQFHSANKLPHLTWIFPNAPHNHEAMTTAWYTPTTFSPIPVGRSNSSLAPDTSDEEFNEEAEDEILSSAEYICSLIDEEIKKGVNPGRIVIGGFSQGCAVSLMVGLASRFAGKIAGVVGLSGYLPRGEKIKSARGEYYSDGKKMRVFLGHGTKDMMVPMRVFRDTKSRVARIVGEGLVDSYEYEGMGHVTSGPEFRDMCGFLETVLPE